VAEAGVAFRVVASQWQAAPIAVDAAYDDLVTRYREPHRRYHTFEHVTDVVARVHGTEVELAAWYHDVIYDATRSDNEARSADHAAHVLSGLGAPADVIAEVRRLILLTAGHEAEDPRGRDLIAADLAILTSERARYQQYVRDVRAEYAHVDDDAWRTGRAAVLERLRAFVDDDSNLLWELGTLSAPQA
jgi:predicted metal-dependent HD superfamily phosphohydrolase